MKHLLHSLALRVTMLIALLVSFGSSGAWADKSTLTFTAACGGSGTADDGVTWTVTSDAAESNYDSTKGIHYGTGSAAVSYVQLVSASFSGTVTSVVVNTSNASSSSSTVTVSVGGTVFKCNGNTSVSASTSATDYTFTGSASGAITVRASRGTAAKKAMYVKSIVVTYSSTPLANISLTSSDVDLKVGETNTREASSSTTGATITYSSNATGVATVTSSGVVTAVSEGTATITATAAADGYTSASASYKVNVSKNTTDISMSEETVALYVGGSSIRTATSSTTGATISYSSDATGVATVASTGEVTAVAAGTAHITATATPANTTSHTIETKTYTVTVSKYTTSIALSETAMTLELKDGAAEALTTTVTVTETSGTITPSITWSSSDETVATVDAGVVTPLKVGTTTITATYAGDGTYVGSNNTCAVTVEDNRTAVNITGFSAVTNPIVKTNTTATSVTTNQKDWTPSYTYESSNTDVATIAADGTITTKAKGTSTITVNLNVNPADNDYKAGTTTSMNFLLTVTNPFHTVTFSNRGSNFITPASVEEGESITFPGSNPEDYNGYSFVGWTTGTIFGTTEEEPTLVTSAAMSTSDVIYYAVYAEADVTYDEYSEEKTQTLEYDTWSYSGSTTNKSGYRLFHSGSYIESAAFDLSLLKSIKVYGGTFGGSEYNSLTIGDGTNTWKSVTVSGKSETGENTYTSGTALSGTKALRVTSNSGTADGTGVRISKVEIFTKKRTVSYAHYCTTVTALPIPVITIEDVIMTWGESGKSVFATATVDDAAYDGTFTYSCEDANMTVNSSTGALSCNVPGTYYVKAAIAATGDHQAAEKTCVVTVNKKSPTVVITPSFTNKDMYSTPMSGSFTGVAQYNSSNIAGATVTYSSSDETVATINASTGAVTFVGVGSTTLTASYAGDDKYGAAEASYVLTLYDTTPQEVEVDITFNNTLYGTSYTGTDAAGNGPFKGTTKGLTVTVTQGSSSNLYVNNSETRIYGGTNKGNIKIDAPTGYVMTNIAFTAGTWDISSVSTGSLSSKTWTGSASSMTIYANSRSDFQSAVVTLAETVTIGDAGYTTYVAKHDISFPVDVTAYIATATSSSTVTLTSKASVPEGTAVVVKGEAGTYALPTIKTDPESVTGNLLQASDGNVEGNGSIYALAKKNGEVGFYLVKSGVSVPAGKAYLDLSGSGVKEFLGFNFDTETGITEAAQNTEGTENLFDLSGRRVSKAQKGLYIVNGRKVLVK